MSGIIKSGIAAQADCVKDLFQAAAAHPASNAEESGPDRLDGSVEPESRSPSAVDNRAEALDRQCMDLEKTIADLRHQLRETEEAAAQSEEAALERGRNEAVSTLENHEAKRLDALQAALVAMRELMDERLASIDVLGLHLARAALGRILADEARYAQLIQSSLALQATKLQREFIAAIRVSSRDFGSPEALAELAATFPGLALEADEKLTTGEARIALHLGEIELGIPGQWQRLNRFFEQLAEEECPG